MHTLPVHPDDADFFATDTGELDRQSNEAIFFFLIIGGKGILVHDDNRGVMCTVRRSRALHPRPRLSDGLESYL